MAKAKTEGKKQGKKAKGEKESPFEPIKDIRKALHDCQKLMDDGIISLELRYPYDVVFRVDEEKFENLDNWDEKKRKKFRRLLSQEITLGLEGALSGDIVPAFAPHVFDSKMARKEAEVIMEETRKVLVTPAIEDWSRVKHSSKNSVLQSVDWEINTKERDRHLGDLKHLRYATVRLWHSKAGELERSRRLFIFPPFLETKNKSLTFDLHSNEIKGLINDLTKILKALDKAES
jgi:hypothetical protein